MKAKIHVIKKIILLGAFAAMLITGCTAQNSAADAQNGVQQQTQQDTALVESAKKTYTLSEHHRIIIDSDAGGDDALAIMMAAKSDNITIEGITVVAGNVELEKAGENALAALEAAGVSAPVYLGASESFNGVQKGVFSVYGSDGMGDADLVHPTGRPEEMNAVDFIIESAKKYPDELEIVAIGPVTNIALAIKKDPEAMSHIKRIWSMGTAGLGQGNATPVSEFNVYKDAEAYKIMLDATVNTTILGFDLCENEDALVSSEQLEKMKNGNDMQKFVALAFGKLLEFRKETQNKDNVCICDPLLMANVIWSDLADKTLLCNASCIDDEGSEAYGQVIFYRSDMKYDSMPDLGDPETTLILSEDASGVYDAINELFTKS